MSQQIIEVRELDLETIPPLTSNFEDKSINQGVKIVMIGAPGTGKSSIIKSLLYSKRHIFPTGMALSGTEDSNHFYKGFMPDSFVFSEYNEDAINQFIKRQKLAKKYLPNPWSVLIVDDCTDDPKVFNKPLQQALFKKGRHWDCMYILSLQYGMDVRRSIRTNIDGVFICRDPNIVNRKTLYENYASVVPDFDMFCQLMDGLTEDFHCIYIKKGITNNWKDLVFYYKAIIPPKDFKLGCPEYWQFHEQRYNPDYIDAITGY